MVFPFDLPETPLTAIWGLHEDGDRAPKPPPWRAVVVHWTKINYAAEKLEKNPGTHPPPDYMADIFDPRATPKAPITNAAVEGRLLEASFQKKPFLKNSEYTDDKLTFMIDGDAKTGDFPEYHKKQKAFICGFASHNPPSHKGSEMIKPIFRDDFRTWGHIEEGSKKWRIVPMYFIAHANGVEGLTSLSTSYKFPIQPSSKSRRVATPAPQLQSSSIVEGDDSQAKVPDQTTEANGTEDTKVIGGGDIKFGSAEEEQDDVLEPTPEELQDLEHKLEEADFGPEAAEADKVAAERGDDW